MNAPTGRAWCCQKNFTLKPISRLREHCRKPLLYRGLMPSAAALGKCLKLLGFAAFFVVFTALSPKNLLANQGKEIMRVQKDMDKGFHDEVSTLSLTLINAHGEKNTRKLINKRFEMENDGDKSISRFLEPRDIKGTALLTYEHKVGSDDQWLYLPALKRIKRISSKNKSGSFMGSEFSYEDLASFEVEKFTYKFIETRNIDGVECFVIERYPVDENSGYTKQIVYLRKDNYQFKQVKYYDRKGDLLKIAHYAPFVLLKNKYWRPTEIVMKNIQTRKETIVKFTERKLGSGLRESEFSKRTLKRR